jgi:hypothetical protein
MNYANANGKVPLVNIVIKGHNAWQGAHPIAPGAYNLDYIADEAYEVTHCIKDLPLSRTDFQALAATRGKSMSCKTKQRKPLCFV